MNVQVGDKVYNFPGAVIELQAAIEAIGTVLLRHRMMTQAEFENLKNQSLEKLTKEVGISQSEN